MRKFTQQQELSAPAASVVEMITREDYLRFRYEDPQLLAFNLDISRDDENEFACKVERVVSPGDSIPKIAKRMLGDRFSVVQETRWSRSGPPFNGSLKVTIPGMPGSIFSELVLSEIDTQCSQMETIGSIEVKIPLAGGQIERMLAGVAEETFTESMRSINQYIAKSAK